MNGLYKKTTSTSNDNLDINGNSTNDLVLDNNNAAHFMKKKKIATTAVEVDISNNKATNGNLFKVESHLDEEFLDWNLDSSEFAKQTSNPVRKLIEQMKIEPNPQFPMIALSIGDPTVFSDIGKPESVEEAIIKCVKDKKYDGYTPSYGTETARQAVAKYYSKPDYLVYKAQDIYLSNGCSQAIDLCIQALASRGDNFIIPKPGFSIYKTLCGTLGINVKYYQLLDEKNWECDLEEMESLIDEKTVGIIVNNPSNPCGSVYSREHLISIIRIAEKHRLPIIADEVYGEMVFPGQEFYYMAELTQNVPILSCNALSKRFILPGWRFGWIAIHDPKDHLKRVRAGFNDLTTRILGPNSLVQGAVPDILEKTPQSYFDNVMIYLAENANIVYTRLSRLPGLTPRKPSGAMYLMVRIDLKSFPGFNTDLDFVQALIREKSVFCLPAQIFECPSYIRIVITMKKEKIIEACDRIEAFVLKHFTGTD